MADQTSIIPNNWKETTLGKVAKVQTGPFGSQLHNEDYVSVGTPMITVENLVNDHINHSSDTPKVSAEDKARLARYILHEGDIVFSRVGSVDRCGYVSAKENDWLFSGRLLRVRPAKEMFNKYVFYWVSQQQVKEYVRKIAVGATMPSINTDLLSQLPISFPPLPEQKAIAAILSSFDDKIELLRRQNKTLENIAQAIFKEWFVNFKVNGKKLKINSKTSLPEGWRMGKYGELADVTTGKGLKQEFIKEKGKYSILGANGELGKTDSYLFDEDLILTGRVGTLGTIYISRGKTWISDNVLISKPLFAESFYFVYFNLKKCNFESLNRGSTQPLITQTDLKNVEIIIPQKEVLESWHNVVSSLFFKIYNNDFQIQTISKLRDALLPKLMRGEIRITGL